MLTSITPLLDTPGDGGSGGGPPSGGGDGGGGVAAPPSAVKLSNEALVDFGDGKPVKFGDHITNRFVDKAEFTRRQQEFAARERQWQEKLAAAQREAQQARQPGPGPTEFERELASLADAPYVNGKQVQGVVQKLVSAGLKPLMDQNRTLAQALKLVYDQQQGLSQSVTGLSGQNANEKIASLVSSTREAAKLPNKPVIEEFLKDIYYSHEGPKWEQEYPDKVKTRWAELVTAVREWDKEQAEVARRANLPGLPGRGGNGTPGRPLTKGFQSPEDIAKTFFSSFRDDT